MEITRHLARAVTAAREGDLPDALLHAAARSILDLVAAALAGITAEGPAAIRRTAQTTLAPGNHAVWFTGERTSLIGAIWCNGAIAAAQDLDDGHRLARGHPGAAIIPAAFAGAEAVGASTQELLRAIVVGYQIGVSVGAARRFYANTGMWSGYGVVAALGYLRGTPEPALAQAFAIFGASAPNQLHTGDGPAYPSMVGSDVKEGIPWSNVTAAHALLLAEAGHTGPLGLLDVADHIDTQGLLANLGDQGQITRSYFKFLACCRHVHGPVEALLGLMDGQGLRPADIDAIEVETYAGALRLANRVEPVSVTDIQFSIPYCLGLAALGGREALLPIPADALSRPAVVEIARKVSLRLDAECERRFPAETLCRVAVTVGARRYVSPLTAPRGEASDPPSWDALEAKLRTAARLVAAPVQLDRVIEAVRHLRDGDHRPLMQIFSGLKLR